jgi:methylglyoxal synthase
VKLVNITSVMGEGPLGKDRGIITKISEKSVEALPHYSKLMKMKDNKS